MNIINNQVINLIEKFVETHGYEEFCFLFEKFQIIHDPFRPSSSGLFHPKLGVCKKYTNRKFFEIQTKPTNPEYIRLEHIIEKGKQVDYQNTLKDLKEYYDN